MQASHPDEHFALMWVSSTDQVPDMITLLTKLPETPLPDMEKFLQCAAAFGAITMVTHFLNLGVDPTTEDNLALRLAAENGHAEVVALLRDTDHALRTASENGHKEVVKVLLGVPTVNPASVNNASIVEASSNGHVEIVRMLMETGRVLVESGMVDPNERVGDAIKVAIENGHVEVVKALRRFEVGWRGKEVEGRVGSVLEAVEVLNGDVYSSSASETDIAVAREVEGMIFYV
ncbi:hypothetical protein BC829DRAFT_390317 [Chytridium lagenaria]|nr:hypothetical protein BC829DRAFT_390317 [Chytridium lagenaria]